MHQTMRRNCVALTITKRTILETDIVITRPARLWLVSVIFRIGDILRSNS